MILENIYRIGITQDIRNIFILQAAGFSCKYWTDLERLEREGTNTLAYLAYCLRYKENMR
jgi:hypothetical protein